MTKINIPRLIVLVNATKPFNKILLAILFAVIGYELALFVFVDVHALLIGVVILLITLWTNEGLPLGAVSLLPIILFPALEIIDTSNVSANYSKPIVFLFLGGFMLALAVEKINLHKVFAHKLLSTFPNTVAGVTYALTITSALLSAVLSNTTTTLLLMPIGLCLSKSKALQIRFVLAIAYGASIGGIMTPIGTPPNLILLGFLEANNLIEINFVEWMYLTMPLALIMLSIVPYILAANASDEIKENIDSFNFKRKLSGEQKRLTLILLAIILLLFFNSKFGAGYYGIGLNEKGLLLGFGLLMFMPKIGFLGWEDTKKIPYEIIFLFGAGFSIASAFSQTGLAVEAANYLLKLNLASMTLFLIVGVIVCFVIFITEITSNTALISILLPIIYSLNSALDFNLNLILIAATISSSYAFMLPIATPPNAIAMSSGVLKIKHMASYGFIVNLIAMIATIFIATFWFSTRLSN